MNEEVKTEEIKIENITTPGEILTIMRDPAVFVNHIYAVKVGQNTRITLAERTGDHIVKVPRFTFILDLNGIVELTSLMNNIMRSYADEAKKTLAPMPEAPKVPKEELN